MNLELSAEQKLIQQTAREFAAAQLQPVAAQLDRGENRESFFANLRQLAERKLAAERQQEAEERRP